MDMARSRGLPRRWFVAGSSLLSSMLVVLVGGCGSGDLGNVSGTVTLDGQPLPNAQVTFMPDEGGGPSFGETDAQGKYTLTHNSGDSGAVPGKHTVSIEMIEEEQDYDAAGTDEGTLELKQDSKKRLPARYNEASELTAEVEQGSTTVDFPLTSE